MSEWPLRGAFPHQHGDPRGLVERIEVQLRERLEEAVEMAALKLMVDLRAQAGRPAPESTSVADRADFQATTHRLLAGLRDAFLAELPAELRPRLEAIERGAGRPKILPPAAASTRNTANSSPRSRGAT